MAETVKKAKAPAKPRAATANKEAATPKATTSKTAAKGATQNANAHQVRRQSRGCRRTRRSPTSPGSTGLSAVTATVMQNRTGSGPSRN